MLARPGGSGWLKQIPQSYQQWNMRYGAPFGRPYGWLNRFPLNRLPPRVGLVLRGPFAVQPNNSTRAFEYPWAFSATPLSAGMRVLEIGGGLSGFQFVLERHGCKVVNVDPGMEARGRGWPCDSEAIAGMNRAFGTSVELRNTVVKNAALEGNSFDRAFSISVLEHLPEDELEDTVRCVYEVLKPGGCLILTIDLFLDIWPFTDELGNAYGRNVDVRKLVECAPFVLELGNKDELLGFEEFDHMNVLRNISDYVQGGQALVQCLVLRKPGDF